MYFKFTDGYGDLHVAKIEGVTMQESCGSYYIFPYRLKEKLDIADTITARLAGWFLGGREMSQKERELRDLQYGGEIQGTLSDDALCIAAFNTQKAARYAMDKIIDEFAAGSSFIDLTGIYDEIDALGLDNYDMN